MKILIISHNPISTFNNMGKTIGSLFSGFAKEELCQLYIHPSVPDLDICNSYYRITDRDILMSYVKLYVEGCVVSPDTNQHERSDDTKSGIMYRKVKSVGMTKRLIRDFFWKFANWNNEKLKKWLEKESPTHIFVAPGMQKFLYDIALCISKKINVPIITYICDDYYFLPLNNNLIIRFANWRLRSKIQKLMVMSKHVVFICDPLREAYQEHFEISATTIMTGTDKEISDEVSFSPHVRLFVYMGNLYYNREKSLVDIGRVLDEINKVHDVSCVLDIYSGDISDSVAIEFNEINSVKLHGFVSGVEYERIVSHADVLIHVEGFDKNSYDMVKFSVSTKIAESLASGKVFLSYGPSDVASVRHLNDNGYICSASNKRELEEKIHSVLFDNSFRLECITQASKIASQYHKQTINSKRLRDIFTYYNS